MEIHSASLREIIKGNTMEIPAAAGCSVKSNQLEPGFTISPSVPARRGGLGLFLLYFHHVIFNAIEIEIVISPSLLGLFLSYFDCVS